MKVKTGDMRGDEDILGFSRDMGYTSVFIVITKQMYT